MGDSTASLSPAAELREAWTTPSRSKRRVIAAALAAVAVANLVVIVRLWLRAGGVSAVGSAADALTSAGRLTALLGTYLALIAVLLLARVPLLEDRIGFGRLTAWHGRVARWCLALLVAHAALTTAGLTVGDHVSLPREVVRLITEYPGVITAMAALIVLMGVGVTSAVVVRRRLSYESWYFVHLYTYLAIALAFSHQLATGKDFVGDSAARVYWIALYATVLGALVVFRVALPLARDARHRLRVERVREEAPGVVTIEITGRRLARLRARPGQFFLWRFLTRDRWWQAHPFSLSAPPDGRRLRITIKDSGDFTARLRELEPGTRVLAEGPFGGLTADAAGARRRVALIAGGAGIAPIRALLETIPGARGDIALIYRASDPDEVLFRSELDELGQMRDAPVHYCVGANQDLEPATLEQLVPDLADRDVFVCGPPAMVEATVASLRSVGVPRRRIVTERFAF
jgi:predicted ferric reductase